MSQQWPERTNYLKEGMRLEWKQGCDLIPADGSSFSIGESSGVGSQSTLSNIPVLLEEGGDAA